MNTSLIDLLEAYPIPEEESKPNYQIYCDMDGVLTDFETRFYNKVNTCPSGVCDGIFEVMNSTFYIKLHTRHVLLVVTY